MTEKYYIAADGAKIAYFVEGEGEPVLCMHGSGEDKGIWEQYGWLQELKKEYTVIAMDIRGFGNSSIFKTQKYYEIRRILDDIEGVMRCCNANEYRYIGHSYGATIGFQAVRAGLPILKAVCASGSMNDSFFQDVCPKEHQEYEMLANVKRNNTLESLTEYSSEDIEFIKQEDMEKFSALFGAWAQWKPVKVKELRGKVSIYSGTNDYNTEMIVNTTIRKAELLNQGIQTYCFEGLNHEELISNKTICLPWTLKQLKYNLR